MKKLIICMSICLLLFTPFPKATWAKGILEGEHRSAILIEQQTGEIMYEENAHQALPPASMTKLMTMLLVMEALENEEITLEEKVTISEYAASMGGSQIFLERGEEMTVEDLLKAVAIASANDASVALAEKIAGTEALFIERMNEKLASLGLKNTHFSNTSGLPAENHYSSAYDMAMIARELLTYDTITSYTSIYEDYLREGSEDEFWLVNTNKLVRFHPEVDGLKTGFTSEAMYCLTASAYKDDMRLVAVIMGAPSAKERNSQIMDLFDYGYATYETVPLFDKGEVVQTYDHFFSKDLSYDLVTTEAIHFVKRKTDKKEQVQIEVEIDERLRDLPIPANEPIGQVKVMVNDEQVIESSLKLQKDVQAGSFVQIMTRLWKSVILPQKE